MGLDDFFLRGMVPNDTVAQHCWDGQLPPLWDAQTSRMRLCFAEFQGIAKFSTELPNLAQVHVFMGIHAAL